MELRIPARELRPYDVVRMPWGELRTVADVLPAETASPRLTWHPGTLAVLYVDETPVHGNTSRPDRLWTVVERGAQCSWGTGGDPAWQCDRPAPYCGGECPDHRRQREALERIDRLSEHAEAIATLQSLAAVTE